MNRTDRLMAILLELQARGELRGEDLARRFEVSVRTIYRDLEALSEGGVPLVATPGKGYRLMDGYFLAPLHLTADEAAVLTLGGEFVRDRVDPVLRRAAEDALHKLVAILPTERREAVARWRRELLFASWPAAGELPWLADARRAIQEHRVARLLYHAFRRPEPELRDVEPVSLVHLDGLWHLAAYCRLRQDRRFFRLDRVDRLQLLPERFTPSERHTLDRYYARQVQEYPRARARFDPAVVRWVRERQPYVFLHEELDAGGPIFVYALRDDRELLRWLLSWGAEVEVLDPPELRARLAAEAGAIAERHAEIAAVAPAPDTTLSGAPP